MKRNVSQAITDIFKYFFLFFSTRGWLPMNFNDYRLLPSKMRPFWNWDEMDFFVIHFKVHSYSNCHRELCISSAREVKSQQNNKKRIVQLLFASFEIIIGFLSVIEFLKDDGDVKTEEKSIFPPIEILRRKKLFATAHEFTICVLSMERGSDKIFKQ